jgi:hypothetical protein
MLLCARSIPSLASLKPQAWRSMWACTLIPSLAATAARLSMRLNPGGVIGAPRSDTKTKGEGGLSLRWRRRVQLSQEDLAVLEKASAPAAEYPRWMIDR